MVDQQKQGSGRGYRMSRRALTVDETRQRIVAATFELHGEIGPARTTISAVADRAGVQRHTVYNHFPDLSSLFEACTAHGLRVMGLPEGQRWRDIADPAERLRHGLTELYRVYRTNAPALGMILRDMPVLEDVGGYDAFNDRMGGLFAALADGWPDGDRHPIRAAAIRHAMQFDTWRSLTDSGLTDDQARDLLVDLVARAG